MNKKHYVSLDVAKMLKEKGFNESCLVLWDEEFKELIPASSICSYKNQNHPNGYCSAPSLLEAMDWLEKKGVYMEIRFTSYKIKGVPMVISPDDEYEYNYFFIIVTRNCVTAIFEDSEDDYPVTYTDRNECINAAINKGAELL